MFARIEDPEEKVTVALADKIMREVGAIFVANKWAENVYPLAGWGWMEKAVVANWSCNY
jgi:hypothetical protein